MHPVSSDGNQDSPRIVLEMGTGTDRDQERRSQLVPFLQVFSKETTGEVGSTLAGRGVN